MRNCSRSPSNIPRETKRNLLIAGIYSADADPVHTAEEIHAQYESLTLWFPLYA
jgi:hypothetical protein